MLSKNVNNKKCDPKLILFNEKKLRKIPMIFDIENWLFDTSPLHQFSKFNNFIWVCWFLGKNLSNFVPPVWKLDNPYYHNFTTSIWRDFFLLQPFPVIFLKKKEIKNFTYFFSCNVSSKKLRISHLQFDEIFFHLQPILDACLERYRWVVSNQSWD